MSFEDKEAKWQAETFVYLFHLLPFLPPPPPEFTVSQKGSMWKVGYPLISNEHREVQSWETFCMMVQGPSAEDPFLSVNMQLYTRFLGSFSVNSSIFLLYN
jgi:hypothetical protein